MAELERVVRWDRLARAIHWLFVVSVGIGIITGLPTLDGERFNALIYLVGGRELRAVLHHYFITAALSAAFVLILIRFAIVVRRPLEETGEEWVPTTKDFKDSLTIALNWLGFKRPRPPIGFHHPLEKYYIHIMHLGLLLLGISGIPLAFLDVGPYRWLLLLTHDLGLVILIPPLVGHIMLAVNPVNWETLKAVFIDGKVSVAWAKKHHPAWKVTITTKEEK